MPRPFADLVEVRLDLVDRPDAIGAIEGRRRPVLVTCRAQWEGGGFHGSEEERERILSDAQNAGAEFVDVEARAEFVSTITRRRRGRGIVLSLHAFGEPPCDLVERARAMRSTGAEIVKIAIEAQRSGDTMPLMRLADRVAISPIPTAWTVTSCSPWGSPGCRRGCSPRGWATAGPTPATASRRARCRPRGCSASSGSGESDRRRAALRRGRQSDRALAVAGDAQRRVQLRSG